MHLLLSGEGPGDIGACDMGRERCEGGGFKAGPMTVIVDQLVEQRCGYSHLEWGMVSFVSEKYLADHKPSRSKKALGLPGKRTPRETGYFYHNARALATAARQRAQELDDTVIAALFRDADGTASSGRGEWDDKWQSMERGFAAEDFDLGVPMLPKPKSEAWLLCALKSKPYQHCEKLENASGNDDSPSSLKKQLAEILDGEVLAETLCEMIRDGGIDVERIVMPSFGRFRKALLDAAGKVLGQAGTG